MSQREFSVFAFNDRLLTLLNKHSLSESKFTALVRPPYYARDEKTVRNKKISHDNTLLYNSKVTNSSRDEKFIYVKEKDKLFWYLMMIVNQWDIDDLPEQKKRFYFEREEKTKAVELLQKTSAIPWKELKLAKTEICTNLACGSSKPVTLSEFVALCYLYEKNVILRWGKCFYKINGGMTGPDQTWYIIHRTKSGERLVMDNSRHSVYQRVISECFQVKRLDKKLGSEASYKLNELEQIATKLGISVLRDDGKKMRKKEIYNLLLSETEKID